MTNELNRFRPNMNDFFDQYERGLPDSDSDLQQLQDGTWYLPLKNGLSLNAASREELQDLTKFTLRTEMGPISVERATVERDGKKFAQLKFALPPGYKQPTTSEVREKRDYGPLIKLLLVCVAIIIAATVALAAPTDSKVK